MIRLAVADVDGTLLPCGEKRIDKSILRSIERLLDGGIAVAIASGRSACELEDLFSPLSHRLSFICFDGALILSGRKTVLSRPIDASSLALFFKHAKATLSDAVFFGKDACYSLGGEAQKKYEAQGNKVNTVSSLYEIKEPIYKISLLGKAPFLNGQTRTRALDGSSEWSEFASDGTSKGAALSYLQLKLGASAFDTAVLGNGENDVPMLKHASVCARLPDARETYSALATRCFSSATEFFDSLI